MVLKQSLHLKVQQRQHTLTCSPLLVVLVFVTVCVARSVSAHGAQGQSLGDED